MNKLVCVLPYCETDAPMATRLLNWINELDAKVDHHLLIVADNAVPIEIKRSIDALGKSVFTSAYTIEPKCPAAVGMNYHPAAAVMFERAMFHIDSCLKWPWLWMEPDCVPLKSGWMDALADAYEQCPKRFMGSIAKVQQTDVPPQVMFATAVYPNCAYSDLKEFCHGRSAFDMAFSPYVVPRAQDTKLIWHVFGGPGDAPTFKEARLPEDGPNVGTLAMMPKEAVLFHRNKDGSLINLLRKQMGLIQDAFRHPLIADPSIIADSPMPIKRKPGRPPKAVESIPIT